MQGIVATFTPPPFAQSANVLPHKGGAGSEVRFSAFPSRQGLRLVTQL
jgi:hypothetical protein